MYDVFPFSYGVKFMLKKLVSGLLTVSLTLAFVGVADAASVSQLQKHEFGI